MCVRALPLVLHWVCPARGAVTLPEIWRTGTSRLRRCFVAIAGIVAVQVGRRPSLAAPARRRPSRRAVAPARLATPARAAPSCSPAGPFTSQPGARLALGGRMGAARGRGSGQRSLATDPLPARSNAPHPCRGRPFDAFPHDTRIHERCIVPPPRLVWEPSFWRS